MRIDVDGDEHRIAAGAGFAVSDQVVIVGAVKLQAPVALQRCVLASDAIHECNKLAQAGRVVAVPMANLILLGVVVLLFTRCNRPAVHELEGRPIDAVARAEGGRQHQADHESRAAAVLQVFGQDVRGVGPEVGAEEITDRRLTQLGEILDQLVFGVAPREVVV